MSSFLTQTTQLHEHTVFGVVWDADHNQHLMRLSPAAQLYLTTPDARALYISLGVSLASRGAIAPPADLAGRLEVLARMLRWANQTEFAGQVEEILAAFAPVVADAPARIGEPDRLTHRLADCGYPDGCTGCVVDHRDPSECTEVCNPGNCQVQHGLEFGADPAPTRPLPVASALDGADR
ncbi:hypothetical protein [Nocardia brasiliensis]|uniref:hypothetical protein n=1 Tax=Nocardia brasiliensis TaxID=37326 RepID=UPI0024587B28|nr:hypothetical protein [Nocardia brasiliensis]